MDPTRRSLLRGIGFAAAATGGVIGATAAPVHISRPATPRERFDAAVAELKEAAAVLRPDINDWKVEFKGGDHFMPVMILAVVRDA
jgi:hypothetical protein